MRHEWLWKRWLIGRDWIGADDAIDRRRRRRDAFDVTGDAAAHVGAATLHLGPPRRRHSSSYYFPTKKKTTTASGDNKRKTQKRPMIERERRRKTVGATIKAESEVVHDERRALFDAIDPASTTQSRKRRRRSIEQQQSHPVQREREREIKDEPSCHLSLKNPMRSLMKIFNRPRFSDSYWPFGLPCSFIFICIYWLIFFIRRLPFPSRPRATPFA